MTWQMKCDLLEHHWGLQFTNLPPSPSPWAMAAVSCPHIALIWMDGWNKHQRDSTHSWHKDQDAFLF